MTNRNVKTWFNLFVPHPIWMLRQKKKSEKKNINGIEAGTLINWRNEFLSWDRRRQRQRRHCCSLFYSSSSSSSSTFVLHLSGDVKQLFPYSNASHLGRILDGAVGKRPLRDSYHLWPLDRISSFHCNGPTAHLWRKINDKKKPCLRVLIKLCVSHRTN